MESSVKLPQRTLSYGFASLLPQICYLIVLGGLALFSAQHPKYGWDMLGYIGVIASWHTSDGNAIHESAYSAIKKLPEYGELIGTTASSPVESVGFSSYRADAARSSAYFVQQLRFYSVKPLYVLAVAALHRCGLAYPTSFAMLSAVAYFATGVVTWIWLSHYWSGWLTTLFAALIMVNPELAAVGRSATPDAFALMFVAWGLYLLLEFPKSISGPLLLLTSIWVRPDTLILVGLLLIMSLWLRVIPAGVSGSQVILSPAALRIGITKNWPWFSLMLLLLVSYLAIQLAARPYSWSTLFYHSFVAFLSAPADVVVKVTPRMYLHTFATSARTLVGNTDLGLIVLLEILAALLHTIRRYRLGTAVILLAIFIHFIFYPSDSARFHAAAQLFIPVSLLIACAHVISPASRLPDSATA
jgi:hypothetical protein